MESLTDQVEAVQSLSQLQGLAAVQQELADSLPRFSNESDKLQDLELFLCGRNMSSGAGLSSVFRRLTQGDAYQRGQH